MSEKQKKKSTLKTILVMALLAAVILGGYFILSNPENTGKLESDAEESEYSKIINRDMEKDYPYSVREVARYYCRIMKCLMNDSLDGDEIEALVDRLRLLFDDQLLEMNEREAHILALKSERSGYIDNSIKINNYVLDSAENVRERTTSEGSYAMMSLYFSLVDGNNFDRSFQDFVFRKDDLGRWKILGWQRSEKTSLSD